MSESPHSDHPIDTGGRRRHLRLVETPSSEATQELETSLSLEFFDIEDRSLSDADIAARAAHLRDEVITQAKLREYPNISYPNIIARKILEEVHVQPDLDALRTAAETEDGLTELERKELEHGLAMEHRFRVAKAHIETQMEAKKTQEFVEALEAYTDEMGHYDSNALRLWNEVRKDAKMRPFTAPILVAGRIIKTMLLLGDQAEEESAPTPQP